MLLFILFSVLALLAQAESNATCEGYTTPMTRDGALGWDDKWALIDTAVQLHCATPDADPEACETYTLARIKIRPEYYYYSPPSRYEEFKGDVMGRWRVHSFNDSACADPWAPDLTRASTVMAPRLLKTNTRFTRQVLNTFKDAALGWDDKWNVLQGLLEIRSFYFSRQYNDEARKSVLRLWSNVARKNAWAYDPWDSESTETASHLNELFDHPKFATIKMSWW